MADELEINKGGVVSLIDNHELGEILKPLVREIYLFNSYVAGTTHLEDQSVLGEIKEEDDLLLQREDNRFDQNAILVLTNERRKLGYIPKKDNVVFARLMDAGKLLKAKITTIEHRIIAKSLETLVNTGIPGFYFVQVYQKCTTFQNYRLFCAFCHAAGDRSAAALS